MPDNRYENFIALASQKDPITEFLPNLVPSKIDPEKLREENLEGIRWDGLLNIELPLRLHLEIALETAAQCIEILYKYGILLSDRSMSNVFVVPWLELTANSQQVYRLEEWIVKQIDFDVMYNFRGWDQSDFSVEFGVGADKLSKWPVFFENIYHACEAHRLWSKFLWQIKDNLTKLPKNKKDYAYKISLDQDDFNYLTQTSELLSSLMENNIYTHKKLGFLGSFYYLDKWKLKKAISKIKQLQQEIGISLDEDQKQVVLSDDEVAKANKITQILDSF